MSKLMEKEVRNAAVKGDLTIFSNKNHELLLKKTYQNDNIIHIAAQHKQFDFIIGALNSFPSSPTCELLLRDQNCDGDTPLHIVAQVWQVTVMERLYEFFSTQCGDNAGGTDRVFPWRMVNSDGNTPAHVALRYGNDSAARYLVEKDCSLARVTNQSKETLLHLAIQYHDYDDPEEGPTSSSKENVLPIIELLLKIEGSLACWPNADDLTALHLAASLDPVYCIPVIKTILASCPEAAAVEDERSERTILHLLTNHQVASYEQGIELMQIPEVNALINVKDHQGDTPLHLAARNGDSIMVRVLLKFSPKLGLKNKSGVSLRSLHQQLEEFEEFLSNNGISLYGHRSLYGIPTTKIEEYANTIGVVAALLATITFTAAFTVPGGLDSSNGTPLLLKKAAFQVFMTADVVAMCSSVMVLFCLLWIMTTGHKKESILLLDVSVFLLQTSFHATIVTFMTGLYVTTISIVPAIAISTCVICTLLIIWSSMLTKSANDQSSKLWSLINKSKCIRFANNQFSNLWSWISKPKCLRSSQNTEAN